VDTTGAGDAFVAALTDRWLLADDSPETAGRFAAAAAALNCRAEGARGGIADADRVRRFLAAQE
jgi:sugar/nucleoside kinase (ribokinase family)